MYLVTPSQTPKPVSCGWGNTWDKPSSPSSWPEHAGKQGRRERPLPGRRTCPPKSGVLQLEDSGPGRGGRCAGPRTAGAGGRKLPPPRPGGRALRPWGRRGRVFTNKGAGAQGEEHPGRGRGAESAVPGSPVCSWDTHPARCLPSRPVQSPPAPGFVVLRLPPLPPPLQDPARAVAAATGTRPHNAFLFAPPPAHTALRHAAGGGRAGEPPKT